MKTINEKLKTLALSFCVIYTAFGLLSQSVSIAWALDAWGWDLNSIVEDIVSSKISAYDYDFQEAVVSIVEDCSVVANGEIECN